MTFPASTTVLSKGRRLLNLTIRGTIATIDIDDRVYYTLLCSHRAVKLCSLALRRLEAKQIKIYAVRVL